MSPSPKKPIQYHKNTATPLLDQNSGDATDSVVIVKPTTVQVPAKYLSQYKINTSEINYWSTPIKSISDVIFGRSYTQNNGLLTKLW